MNSILEEFAYGNVNPQLQYFSRNSEFGKAMERVLEKETKLLERLGVEDKELFEKYTEAQSEVIRLTATRNFLYGYKLGLVMTAEAFIGSAELVDGEGV